MVASPRVRRRHADTRDRVLAAAWDLAEQEGLGALTMRDLAAAVDMRAPSLYSYFDGKHAIYDAMFAQGFQDLQASLEAAVATAPPRRDAAAHLTHLLVAFLEFCVASLPRYQLMFTRAVPGWEPSDEAYAVSLASYEVMARHYADFGITSQADLDLVTAVGAGLAAQQLANDPGGRRWIDLAPRAVRMMLSDLTVEVRP